MLPATVAAIGAYYLTSAVVLVALMPFRFSLPMFGTVYYEPEVTILAVMTAIGLAAAAFIAYSLDGLRAVVIVGILAALVAGTTVLPFLAEGPKAWSLPPDLTGLTPAAALTLSLAAAIPGLILGLGLARFRPVRASSLPAFEAAGIYFLTGLAMSLPTPQLDLRLAMPFTAGQLPTAWHAVAVVGPALLAGASLAMRGWPVVRAGAIGAVIGLAGAAPFELPVFLGPHVPYWPVSLVLVPVVTAVVAILVVAGAPTFAPRVRTRLARATALAAAIVGSVVTILGIAAWSLLATIPTASDRNGPVDAIRLTGDERKIVACVMSGRGEEVLGASATERAESVTVAVRLRRPPSWYFHDLVGIPLPVIVTLRDPIGSREVIDAWSQRSVPIIAPGVSGLAWC